MDFIIESRNGLLWVTAIGQASLNKAVVVINSLVDAAIERETNLILVDGLFSGDRRAVGPRPVSSRQRQCGVCSTKI